LTRSYDCNLDSQRLSIEYTDYALEKIREITRIYSVPIEDYICHMPIPSRRYYVRVNLLRSSSDYVIGLLRKEGYVFLKDGRIEEAIYTFVEGPYHLDKKPEKYVVVDKYTAESVLLGANVYAPGVLKVHGSVGDEVAIMDNKGAIFGYGRLVNNPLKTGEKTGLTVVTERSLFKTPKLRETSVFTNGYIYDQSLPSMMVARSLEPSQGDIVIDLTASPGGKITHAYELSGGKALVIGIDRSLKKVERIVKNAQRLGHNIYTLIYDSRKIHEYLPTLKANKIIVDPPCSDLGRRPKTSLLLTEESLKNLVALQRSILKAASKIALPDGLIVYSTCTLTFEENEGNAEWAIRELGLIPEEPPIPLPQTTLSEYPFSRFTPYVMDTPGFFIALLRKKGS
jgi:16S rRNA (cytosine967-C5)-methyltransferase